MQTTAGTPLIEAHRGDSSNAPENTRSAFDRALRLGVPWIELDVHPARDGTLMVIHDDTVDRTTDGSGAVIDLSVEQLSRLDAGTSFSPDYAGERIPQLVDILELAAPAATRLNVEIKASPRGMDVPRAVVDHLHRFDKQRDYVVSSFDLRCLLDVRVIDPEIPLALIGDGPNILPHAAQHHLPWIHGHHATMTRETVAAAHARGIRVNVWTVDDPERRPFWRDIGVDKICTNRPSIMLARQRHQDHDPSCEPPEADRAPQRA